MFPLRNFPSTDPAPIPGYNFPLGRAGCGVEPVALPPCRCRPRGPHTSCDGPPLRDAFLPVLQQVPPDAFSTLFKALSKPEEIKREAAGQLLLPETYRKVGRNLHTPFTPRELTAQQAIGTVGLGLGPNPQTASFARTERGVSFPSTVMLFISHLQKAMASIMSVVKHIHVSTYIQSWNPATGKHGRC